MLRSRLAWRAVFRLAVVTLVVVGQSAQPTAVSANSYPGWANSHYVSYSSSLTTSYFFDRGCDYGDQEAKIYQGGGVTNLAVVLDFGTPSLSGSTYGARLWSGTSGQFESTTWIADRVQEFGHGFWYCSSLTPFMTIMVGVNSDSSTVGAGHGTAWGNMVDTINNWFASHNYDSQVAAMGAIDFESGFAASVSKAKAWVDAYSTATNTSFVYNFGAASGCPTDASYAATPGVRCSGSSGCAATTAHCTYQDDLYYLSWGCDLCTSLPEIYCTTIKTLGNGQPSDCDAQQWEGVRRYAYAHKGGVQMDMSGSMTQFTACAQVGGCSGVNNTQLAGWTHLHNSESYYTPVNTSLPWETDIMWGW
jgi:hypothetical protein